MSKTVSPMHGHEAQTPFPLSYLLQRFFLLCLLISFATAFAAKAESADDQFVKIYNLIQDADTLNSGGQGAVALPKYVEAQKSLQRLQRAQPNWNATVVAFRLNYLAQKISALSEKSVAPSDDSSVQVKLVQAGAEPRRVLRLHPKAGEKQSVVMTLKMAMDLKMGEMQSQAMKMPGMQMAMDATVKTVSESGDIDYDFAMGDVIVMDEPGALPQMVDAIKSSLSGLKGMSGAGKLSNRGINKGTEMKLAADAAPQLRQMMDQMKESFSNLSSPLPEEPVGPGAKWDAIMVIKSQGMNIQQEAKYELVSIDGERLVIRSTIVQHAENQKIENPSMPGVKVDLNKMSGRGTGDRTCDLGLILPSTGAIQYHSDLSMAVNMGAQKQPMAMKMDMDVKMETK